MRKAYLVYNPYAGRFPSLILAERAARVLRERDWEVKLLKSESASQITQFALEAVSQDIDAVFIAGGDGSINHAAEGLVNSQTALGILPAGTSNVFGQELGLPGLAYTRWMALEHSARILSEAEVKEIDIGVCGGNYFLLWAGIGLDGFIVNRIEPRPRWEKYFAAAQYAASAVWTAAKWQGINLKIIADGKNVRGRYILAVVSNIHVYAGGYAKLSPRACLDDGLMDLWLFRGDNLSSVVKHAWDLLAGHHVQSEMVDRIPFQSLQIETDSKLYIQLDAEPLTYPDASVSIAVKPRAIKVLVPNKTPRPILLNDYSRHDIN